jgi:hypothetical protein
MGSSQRRVFVIVGLSIVVHGAVALWAILFGDPFVERPAWAAATRRVFMPDDVIADVTFDATQPVPGPTPAPVAPRPAPVTPPPGPAHIAQPPVHRGPPRLSEPAATPESLTQGLFSDEHAPLAKRKPGPDLAAEVDAARRHDHAAQIGDNDPRTRGDDRARTGTGPDCACDPDIAPHQPAPTPPPDVPPPRIHVDPQHGPAPTSLSPDEVLRIITSRYMAGLQRCQALLLRRDAGAQGRVSLALTIDDGGAISAAAADGVDGDLDRCIEARAAGWRFPVPHDMTSGDATSARYELSLSLQAR